MRRVRRPTLGGWTLYYPAEGFLQRVSIYHIRYFLLSHNDVLLLGDLQPPNYKPYDFRLSYDSALAVRRSYTRKGSFQFDGRVEVQKSSDNL